VEIEAGIASSPPQEITLRLTNDNLGYNHPTAPAPYTHILSKVVNIQRSIAAPRRTFGAAQISTGTIEVLNTGELDEWFSYAYGRPARVLVGFNDAPYDEFTLIISGRIEQPSGDNSRIIFRFQDRTKELERPVSPVTYAGDNSGTTGREGTPQDIGGQHKIQTRGVVKNISPDPINANNQIFAVNHDGDGELAAVESIDAVLVNGSPWNNIGDEATIAALEAASVTQGNFRTCLAAGALKAGGTWQGALTCDVTVGSGASNRIAAVARSLLMSVGVDAGAIDLGTLDSDAPWIVGSLVRGESAREALNDLLGESAIWYAPNNNGVYQLRLVQLPTGAPVVTLKPFDYPNVAGAGDFQITELRPEFSSLAEAAIPAWRVTVNYLKRWTVQDKDALAAAIGLENKEFYSREYSKVVIDNPSIRDFYPDAAELEFNTLLIEESDATSLTQHLFDVYSIPHQLYRVTASLDPAVASVQLGDVVRLQHPRYGLAAGKLGRVIGEQFDAVNNLATFEVWT
jgi:hypothetical protein